MTGDASFAAALDAVFRAAGTTVVRYPGAPNELHHGALDQLPAA